MNPAPHILTATLLAISTIISPVRLAAHERPSTAEIRTFDAPRIENAMGGGAFVASSSPTRLAVTASFGEVTPINPSPVVTVTIPIAVRASGPFRVVMSIDAEAGGRPGRLRPADIGFGIRNPRPLVREMLATPRPLAAERLATKARALTRARRGDGAARTADDGASPRFRAATRTAVATSRFSSDPSLGAVNRREGRAGFATSLADLGHREVVLAVSGARSNAESEWAFDAVFAVVPQFYAPGACTLSLTFTVEPDTANGGTP